MRMSNEKPLETIIKEGEYQTDVIKQVDTLRNEWQDIPTAEKQSERLDELIGRMGILTPTQQEVCANQLAEAGIISKQKCLKQIKEYAKGLGVEDETRKKEDELNYTAYFGGLVDLVEYNGSPAFLVKENETLNVLTQVNRDGKILIPPPKEQIPWLLPRADEVMGLYEIDKELGNEASDSKLYDELLSYHKGISELPSEEYYDLLVAWDLHTYLLENFQYTPIICLFAVPERGKTRTGQGMIYIAFRGIHLESLRDAYLVRVANDLKACLFLDVRDIWRKAEKNGTEDILLHRFEQGAKVPRVLYPERGAHRDMVYYSVFGATIISTNEGAHRILETRAIQINMPETSRRFENDVTPEVALPLKERLVTFRARHLKEILPNIPKPARGRLGDILKPLHQVICLVKPEKESSFLKLVKNLEEGRLMEKADTLEAQILREIIKYGGLVNKGILPVKDITNALNDGKSDNYCFTPQRIGRRLSAMGFKKARTGDGSSAIIWDEKSIERMKGTYGLKETSETSETPETSEILEETACFRA